MKKINFEIQDLINEANFFIKIKNYKSALKVLEKISRFTNNKSDVYYDMGNIYLDLNENSQSIKYFELSINENRKNLKSYINLAYVLELEGKLEDARKIYKSALEVDFNNKLAHYNLSLILTKLKQYKDALISINNAIELDSYDSGAYNHKGNIERLNGNVNNAIICYENAIKLDNKNWLAYFNCAVILKDQKKLNKALKYLKIANEINDKDIEILFELGMMYRELCLPVLAKKTFKDSLKINKDYILSKWGYALAEVIPIKNKKFDLEEKNNIIMNLKKISNELDLVNNENNWQSVGAVPSFYIAYNNINNKEILEEYGNLCIKMMNKKFNIINNNKLNNNKIKIGIISEHIKNHSVWNAITKGMIGNINKEKFELHIYKLSNVNDDDEETEFAVNNSDLLYQYNENFEDLLNTLIYNNLDYIIYPEIGMHQLTIQLASLRIAKYQIAMWGHPETSGLKTIDFFLSAKYFEDSNSVNNYSEKLVLMPNLGTFYYKKKFIRNEINVDSRNKLIKNLEKLNSKKLIICPGTLYKYLPEFDYIFIEISKKIKNSVFIFFNIQEEWKEILYNRLNILFIKDKINIDEFIYFFDFLDTDNFNILLEKSTLYLDTIGFSGFNTAVTALENSLPILTVNGKYLRSRLAAGLLRKINLNQLVCESVSEYIDKAILIINNY